MIGSQDGILPMTVNQILKRNQDDSLHLTLSAMQIYNEQISDLLSTEAKPMPKDLKVKQVMDALHTKEISSYKDARECFEIAQHCRSVGSTSMNAKSSRSHAIFILGVFNKVTDVRSMLYLVDLAGSERIKKSNVSGERIDEAIAINSSLTTLGKCIIALGDKKAVHVPFRESKLTKILQDALGGRCKTALILTLSPQIDDLEESISSLLFGQRAKKVPVRPMTLERGLEPKSMTDELKKQLDVKNQLLQEITAENRRLQSEIRGLVDDQNTRKEEQIKKIELKMKVLKKEHQQRLEDMDSLMLQQEREIVKLREKLQTSQVSAANTQFNSLINNSDISKKLEFPEVDTLRELNPSSQSNIQPKGFQPKSVTRLNKENIDMSLEEYLTDKFEKPKVNTVLPTQHPHQTAKMAELEASNQHLQLKSSSLEVKVENLNSKIGTLQEELDNMMKANKALVEENDKLIMDRRLPSPPRNSDQGHFDNAQFLQIRELQGELSELRGEVTYLREMNQNLESESQTLEEELDLLRRERELSSGQTQNAEKMKEELDRIKEKLNKANCEAYTLNDENIKMAKQICELGEREQRLNSEICRLESRIQELKTLDQTKTENSKANSNDREELEHETARVRSLESEIEKWRRRDEEKEFRVESLYNDLAAVEAQLRISKMRAEEMQNQCNRQDNAIRKAEVIAIEKEEQWLGELDKQKKHTGEILKEKKRITEELQAAESEKKDLETILEQYRKKESTSMTSEQELERFKGVLLETDNWRTERANASGKNNLALILAEAKSQITQLTKQLKIKASDSISVEELSASMGMPRQAIHQTMIAFFSQTYFFDFEKNILNVTSNRQFQETLVREYTKARHCLREVAFNLEEMISSVIDREIKLRVEEGKTQAADQTLSRFRTVLAAPEFDYIRHHFVSIWFAQIRRNKAAIRIQNFLRRIRQQKKMQRLQKRHQSQYERFQAGSGKNLLQLLMKKAEDAMCALYEHVGPIEEDLKTISNARKTGLSTSGLQY